MVRFTLLTSAVAALMASSAFAATYQAENAQISGGLVTSNKITGFTGTGYVEIIEQPAGQVRFTVQADADSSRDLSIYYGGPFGDYTTTVRVNGGIGISVHLPPADVWNTAKVGKVSLKKGSNTIDIGGNGGKYYIDSINI